MWRQRRASWPLKERPSSRAFFTEAYERIAFLRASRASLILTANVWNPSSFGGSLRTTNIYSRLPSLDTSPTGYHGTLRRMSSPVGRRRSTSTRRGRTPGRTNGGRQLRGVHYMVVGSLLPSLLGPSGRWCGQRRRDLTSFGPIMTTEGLVTLPDVRRGGWSCVHHERLRRAVDANPLFYCFGGRAGGCGRATEALAATVVCC